MVKKKLKEKISIHALLIISNFAFSSLNWMNDTYTDTLPWHNWKILKEKVYSRWIIIAWFIAYITPIDFISLNIAYTYMSRWVIIAWYIAYLQLILFLSTVHIHIPSMIKLIMKIWGVTSCQINQSHKFYGYGWALFFFFSFSSTN